MSPSGGGDHVDSTTLPQAYEGAVEKKKNRKRTTNAVNPVQNDTGSGERMWCSEEK